MSWAYKWCVLVIETTNSSYTVLINLDFFSFKSGEFSH